MWNSWGFSLHKNLKDMLHINNDIGMHVIYTRVQCNLNTIPY